MTAKRRKPLLVNLMWSATLLATLGVLYVGGYGGFYWCLCRGVITEHGTAAAIGNAAFTPLDAYIMSDLPGRRPVNQFVLWCCLRGDREHVSWSDTGRVLREVEEMKRRGDQIRSQQAQSL